MTFLVTTFILGVINVFLAGATGAISYLKKKQGENLDSKHYLSIIIPFSVGVYLLVDIFYKITSGCVSIDYA